MLPIFLTFVPFALLFIFFTPTPKTKAVAIMYLVLILLFIWGIGGMVFSTDPSVNEKYVFYAFYIFILGIHIPLILKLSQIDHKKQTLKSAREILSKNINHLTDKELQYRLKH